MQTREGACADVDGSRGLADKDLGIDVEKSWLNIEGLHYSYGACEDSFTFPKAKIDDSYDAENAAVTLTSYATYSKDTCPYKVQPTGCECIGSNDALGDYERARHGQDYGKWCAAWEVSLALPYSPTRCCCRLVRLHTLTACRGGCRMV
jgi:hypothetical protein